MEEVTRQSVVAYDVQAYLKHEETADGNGEPAQFTAGREYAGEVAHAARNGANPYMLSTAMVAILGMQDIGLLHAFCLHLQRELAGD